MLEAEYRRQVAEERRLQEHDASLPVGEADTTRSNRLAQERKQEYNDYIAKVRLQPTMLPNGV